MDGWRTINGVDWLCPDVSIDPSVSAELGVVLAHGYAHESPAKLGIGAAAAVVLARELTRPRETADHRVVELQVAAEVNLQDTVILMRGEAEAVRLGAQALDRVLQDPTSLNVANLPSSRRFAWTGWSSELAAWFGMGPVALAAEFDSAWSGDPTELQEFVRGLHPAQGRRAIAWTTDPGLVGVVFTDPPTLTLPDTQKLAWREPAATARTPASVTPSFQNNLLSVRLPTTRANTVALQVVARTVHRSLVLLTQQVAGLQLTFEQIGSDTLSAVRATPNEGVTDWVAVREALVEALEAATLFSDDILAEEIERASSPEAMSYDLELSSRAISALRSGTRPTPAELLDEYDSMTVEELRWGTRLVQTVSLLGVPGGEAVPNGRPRRTAPTLDPVERPTVSRRSLVPLPFGGGMSRQLVRATPTTLQQTLKPTKTPKQRPAAPTTTTAVDLTSVAARIDNGDTWTTLVDQENRRVTLAWPAYRRAAPLRALVDAATPAPLRIARGDDRALSTDLRTRLNKRRTGMIMLLLVGFFVLMLLVLAITDQRYQQPVVTTVTVGSVVTLANGSTVQVSDAQWRAAPSGVPREYLTAAVRYCGGGVTVDRKTGDDARNYVTPDRFALSGIAPANRPVVVLSVGEAPLRATQLADGQCAEGKIGFEVDSPTPVSGAQITYRNGSGDNLQWTVA